MDMGRDEGLALPRILLAPVPGKRRREKQKTRWKDSCKRDLKSVGLNEEDIYRVTRV